MEIQYLGHSCFLLTAKGGTTILTDPYTRVGYELPKEISVDIVTSSHGHFDHAYLQGVQYKTLVDKAGQQSFDIIGIESFHDSKQGTLRGKNIIFKITVDGITFCHLGDLGEEYNSDLIEKIGKVDVLLLPIGGTYTIDAEQAKAYMGAIKPKTVIPMHYRPADGALDIDGAERFLALFAETQIERIPSGKTEYALEEPRKPILFMERVK